MRGNGENAIAVDFEGRVQPIGKSASGFGEEDESTREAADGGFVGGAQV